ncbi:MAG: hypothetical protein ACYDDA_05160 [Acidiferrobacteraceae bacterium]
MAKTKIKSNVAGRFSDEMMPMHSDQNAEVQRFLGAGAPADVSGCCAATLDAIQCSTGSIPRFAEQRSHYTGPVADGTLSSLFVPQLKLLNQGEEVLGANNTVETNIDSGELQRHTLVVGVYCEIIPFQYVQTIEGGAWTAPTVAGNAPVVPDAWTKIDAATGNGLGLTSPQTLTKAFLDVGGWTLDFAYQFAEAYNLVWEPGGVTIMDMPLRRILKVHGAEIGTSPSRRPFAQQVANANAYYRAPESGVPTSSIFLPRNATRTGTVAIGGVEMSTFEPYDYGDEDVSYDPGPTVALRSNPSFYELPYAVAFPRGLNTNLMFRSVDNTALGRAAQALSYTNNTLGSTTNGATPPGVIAPDQFVTTANFIGSSAPPVFTDLSKDSPAAQVQFQMPIGTTIFKVGDFYIALGFVGWPLSDTVYRQMVDGEKDICSYLQSATAGRCGFKSFSR